MIFKSAKVKRLERMCKNLSSIAAAHHQEEIRQRNEARENLDLAEKFYYQLQDAKKDLAAMTEARDAVSAASKFLRERCDMQDAVLKMIAKHGEANPSWASRIAKAMVEGE